MKAYKIIGLTKSIALVAHNKKKEELIEWVRLHKNNLIYHNLIATETTGKLIEELLQIKVMKVMSGPLGGDQQLGAMISEGKIDILIFFWDPMTSHPHDSDVKALLRLGVVWNILTACNTATADFIMTSSLMKDEYTVVHSNYQLTNDNFCDK